MRSDLIEAARRLFARPSFAALAVLVLTLGIGAGASVLSVVAGVLWRSPPYPEPDRLVTPYVLEQQGELRFPVPVPATVLAAWEALPEVVGVAGYDHTRAILFLEDRPLRVEGARATHDLFELLGVRPLYGRGFLPDDDPSAVVVLDEELFARLLDGDPSRLGEPVRFDDGARTVIGVVPRGLELAWRSPQYWIPGGALQDSRRLSLTVARLASGVSPRKARDLLAAVWRDVEGASAARSDALRVEAFVDQLTARARDQLRVLGILSVLLLAIGCANVGGLLLGRVEERVEELAIRRTLGASRWRLMRLLLAEGIWLAVAAGAAASVVAVGLHRFLAAKVVSNVPGRAAVELDWRLFGGVLALSAASALGVSLVPILGTWRREPGRSLRGEVRLGPGRERVRVQSIAVVAQLALAVVLLLHAGLVLRVLWRQTELASPIRASEVLALRLLVPSAGSATADSDEASVGLWPFVERLQGLSGVEAVAIGSYVPYVSAGWAAIPIAPTPLDERAVHELPSAATVDAGFAGYGTYAGPLLRVLGIPLSAGDLPAVEGDPSLGAGAVVVNRRLARDYWPGEDPIGKTLYVPGGGTLTVSGVVELEIGESLSRLVLRPRNETAWVPRMTQSFAIVARTSGAPELLVAQARALVAELLPGVAVEVAAPLDHLLAEQNAPYRLRGTLYGSVAVFSLALALVGIYGVMSRAASSRRREIGIRIALGARRSEVVSMMLRAGAGLVALGLLTGTSGSWAAARVWRAALPELVPGPAGGGFLPFGAVAEAPVSAWLALGGAPALLAITALLACLVPASRASRADPVEALRS